MFVKQTSGFEGGLVCVVDSKKSVNFQLFCMLPVRISKGWITASFVNGLESNTIPLFASFRQAIFLYYGEFHNLHATAVF